MSSHHDPLAYQALQKAMSNQRALCQGDDRYTADEVTQGDANQMAELCAICPLLAACKTYSDTSRPEAGYWAGRLWPASRKPIRGSEDRG